MILRSKIIAVITLILLVAIGFSTAIALRLQSTRITNSKATDINVLSNIIIRSIENAMGQGNTEDVQKSLENIGKNPEILALKITSPDGYVLKSNKPEEIGLKSSDFGSYRTGSPSSSPIIKDNTMLHFTPILNKKQCYGCHREEVKVNGIIEIKYDISRSLSDLIAIKRLLIFANVMTVLIVAGILGILLSRLIITPLNAFLRSIRAVEGGNWNAKVEIKSNDELGAIGAAFNKMLDEVRALYEKGLKKEKEISRVRVELDHKLKLEELNARLQHKVIEVETANRAVLSLSKEVKSKNTELEKMVERLKKINEVGRILTSIIETDELIKLIIKTTSEMLRVEKGSIYIMKSGSGNIAMEYVKGLGVERTQNLSFDVNPLYRDLMNEGKPVLLNHTNLLPDSDEGAPLSAIGVPLRMKGQIIGGMLLERKSEILPFTADELELLSTMSNQAMVAIENAWLYETVKANYFGTIQALVNALEASDRYTKGHSERVKYLGLELAKYIGLDYKELELFEHAAILHDIGKIGIDTSVLNKAGKLTNSEFGLIRAHPIIGDEILGPIGTLQGVRTTILQHHEKYDGTGYPYGIAGDEISLKARILSVVDTFDAMLTDRPYRKGLDINIALEELRKGANTQFDPFIVNSFLQMIEEDKSLIRIAGYIS